MSTDKKLVKTITRDHEVWGKCGNTIWEQDGLYYVHGHGQFGENAQVLPDRFEHLDDATRAANNNLDTLWMEPTPKEPPPPVQHINDRGEILLDNGIVVSFEPEDDDLDCPALISIHTKGPGWYAPTHRLWRDEARAVGRALLRLADYYPEVEVEE